MTIAEQDAAPDAEDIWFISLRLSLSFFLSAAQVTFLFAERGE